VFRQFNIDTTGISDFFFVNSVSYIREMPAGGLLLKGKSSKTLWLYSWLIGGGKRQYLKEKNSH
jgi:hypothetical protein